MLVDSLYGEPNRSKYSAIIITYQLTVVHEKYVRVTWWVQSGGGITSWLCSEPLHVCPSDGQADRWGQARVSVAYDVCRRHCSVIRAGSRWRCALEWKGMKVSRSKKNVFEWEEDRWKDEDAKKSSEGVWIYTPGVNHRKKWTVSKRSEDESASRV